jgi:c(7)-type cytochrome triheme protein
MRVPALEKGAKMTMFRSSRHRPGLRRGRWAPILAGAGLALGLLVLPLLRATAVEPRSPLAEDPPAEGGEEKEEHGGDILFLVESRIQKLSVLYRHQTHLDAGLDCEACHESIFRKELGANFFKMKDVNQGRACGTCHQNEPPADVLGAFAPKDNCDRCHRIRVHRRG